MNSVFVHAHLGVGDLIVFNGMIRNLATCHEKVVWACKKHNCASAKAMLGDLDNVVVWPVKDDNQAKWDMEVFFNLQCDPLPLGLHGYEPLNFSAWDKQIYRQAGVPFIERWERFNLPGGVRTPEPSEINDAAFLHEDTKRGFTIDRTKVSMRGMIPAKSIPNGTIFDWLPDLQTASEIHVIDSAFLCLADSVPTLAKRLVFHKYARPNGHPPTLIKSWEFID